MIRLRIVMLALSLCCSSWPALAGTPLPAPHVTGPTQVNNRFPLTLQFSYPPVHASAQAKLDLFSWDQYWHCRPGKDNKPPEDAVQELIPFGPGEPLCTRDNNRYMGLEQNMPGSIRVPKTGGPPALGTWYVRTRLVWLSTKPSHDPVAFGPWSAWHRVIVVMSFPDAPKPPNSPYSASHRLRPAVPGTSDTAHVRRSGPAPLRRLHHFLRPMHHLIRRPPPR